MLQFGSLVVLCSCDVKAKGGRWVLSYMMCTSPWIRLGWRKNGEDTDQAVPDAPGTHHHGYSRVEKERGGHRESCPTYTFRWRIDGRASPCSSPLMLMCFPLTHICPGGPGGESLPGESVSIC